jgi:hypothetical protein
MSPKEFADRMRACRSPDKEVQHCDADDLMCEVLRQLGYAEGVEVFEDMDKWYA